MMAGARGSGFRRWRALGAALLEERSLVAAPCITERKRFHKVPSGAVRPPEPKMPWSVMAWPIASARTPGVDGRESCTQKNLHIWRMSTPWRSRRRIPSTT